jgi:hypothetical protein
MACPVSVQERLRGWQCGSFFPGRRPYTDLTVRLTGGRKVHSSRRGGALSSHTPTALGVVLQCPGWLRGSGDSRTGLMVMEGMRLTGPTSQRRPGRAQVGRPSPLRGFRRPLSRVRRVGHTSVGSTVSRS